MPFHNPDQLDPNYREGYYEAEIQYEKIPVKRASEKTKTRKVDTDAAD